MSAAARRASGLLLAIAVSMSAWPPARGARAEAPAFDPIHVIRIEVRSSAAQVRLGVAEPSALIEAKGHASPDRASAEFEGFDRAADPRDFGGQPLVVRSGGAKRVTGSFLAAVSPGDAAAIQFTTRSMGRGKTSVAVYEVNQAPPRLLVRHTQPLARGSFAIDSLVLGARGAAPGTEPLPPKVLAFYYQWYRASDWGGEKPTAEYNQNPLPYDSGDLLTIERQILQARKAGLDGFIVSWLGMGTPEERNLELLVSHLPEGFQFALYLETFYPPFGSKKAIIGQLDHALDKYGSHPNYLHIDGRPAVYAFSTLHVLKRFGSDWNPNYLNVWQGVLDGLAKRGHDPFLIGEGRPFETRAFEVFDGMHAYGTRGQTWTEWLNSSMSLVARAWGAIHGGPRRLYGASIVPGYDDRHLPGRPVHAYLPRENGALYREQWGSATETGADQALVVSFNEWPETTNIEPNREWGSLYLDLTAELAAAFRASRS
ncbi:MAG: hypothetical protein ACRDHM_02625 [Actinomycetota bacterium]